MKKFIIAVTMLFSASAFSQVGVGTSNPQGSFNVDGAKDNPITGTPTALQQANDFTVTPAGNVGIGTTVPGTKLEINNGSTAGAIKILDGTQAENKVLTSDNNGVGTWKYPTSTPSYFGTWDSSYAYTSIDVPQFSEVYTGLSITLPPGRYFVFVDLGYEYGTISWRYASYSTSPFSGSTNVKFVGGGNYSPGIVSRPYNVDIANTTWLIDLSTETSDTTIYFKQSDNYPGNRAACCSDQYSVTALRL